MAGIYDAAPGKMGGNNTGNRGAGDNSDMNPAQPLNTGMAGGADLDSQHLRTASPNTADRQWVDEEDDEL